MDNRTISEVMREMGRRGGKIGGKRSLETMAPEERSERARKAAYAREAKRWSKARPNLPRRDVLRRRLKILETHAPADAYFLRRLGLDKETPAELAKVFQLSEAEVLRRAHAAIGKLSAGRVRLPQRRSSPD
jgi:hypothetical protein